MLWNCRSRPSTLSARSGTVEAPSSTPRGAFSTPLVGLSAAAVRGVHSGSFRRHHIERLFQWSVALAPPPVQLRPSAAQPRKAQPRAELPGAGNRQVSAEVETGRVNADRLAKIFRAVRLRMRWRQVDVARRAGVSAGAVSRIERGRLSEVSLATLQRRSPMPSRSASTSSRGGGAATSIGC